MRRSDERDTIFSRMTLRPGTDRFNTYYQTHPEFEDIDRGFRNAGPGRYADRIAENCLVDSTFSLIAGLRPGVRGSVAEVRVDTASPESRESLDGLALSLNASLTGVCPSDPDFAYSVRGRGERYGQPVESLPENIFVMAFEMNKEETMTAPDPRQSVEVVKVYLKAAVAALTIAGWIRSLGWEAVAHIDGESELILPPVAARAGLGELGRHGLLVTREFGSRVRLSAVTTDMPLSASVPSVLVPRGLAGFCDKCGRCAKACPAGAIPTNGKDSGRVNHEACFSIWKEYGTDCGICLAVCPFSA